MPAAAAPPAPAVTPSVPSANLPKVAAVGTPSVVASPKGEITLPKPTGITPPKVTPAASSEHWKDAFERLDDFTTEETGTTAAAVPTPPPPPKPAKEVVAPVAAEEGEEPAVDPNAPAPDPAKPDLLTKGGKPSPWKMVDHWKGQYAILQKEVAELRTKAPELPKDVVEKLTSMEKRNQELEEEIRYVNFQKTPEFTEKYQKPYEEAWTGAITDLKGLSVQTTNSETGDVEQRDITVQDIAGFANMPPEIARKAIRAAFSDPLDAAEVRGHVDTIRKLHAIQANALEEARKNGAEREKTRSEQFNRENSAVQQEVSSIWQAVNKEATEKYEFMRPVEGQEERNAALDKATKFVDETLRANATNPKLTKEERADVVRKHAALRNRAIAYSVLLHEHKALKAKLAERDAALAAYQGSEPGAGEGDGGKGGGVAPMDQMESSLSVLRKMAS
jgi:FtsZ-binding cell division protein ZapB